MARFERYGVLGTEMDGIFFTESVVAQAHVLGPVEASSNKQNAHLEQLKASLAAQVKRMGGNCVMGFSYAQKATVFSFSSTRITARGQAARIS